MCLDRPLAIALGIPGVAQPILGIGRQRTVGIFLNKSPEADRRFLVFSALELVQCRFVLLAFLGRIASRLGICAICRVDRSSCIGLPFKLAQTRIEVEIEVLLAFFGGFQLVIERFDLAAQTRIFFGLTLDLVGQIQLGLGLLVLIF